MAKAVAEAEAEAAEAEREGGGREGGGWIGSKQTGDGDRGTGGYNWTNMPGWREWSNKHKAQHGWNGTAGLLLCSRKVVHQHTHTDTKNGKAVTHTRVYVSFVHSI